MPDKVHVLADCEGRSANSELLVLIRDAIEKSKERYGAIAIDKQ